MVVRSRETT